MAITVDWSGSAPWLITIPQSDLTLVSGTKYTITVDYLWELLRDFSDSAEAIPFPRLYSRTPATATTPAIIEIDANNYEAQFENGAYSVEIINGNSNFRDVEVKNTVSVGTNNSAGFIGIDSTEIETGFTQVQILKVIAAALGGKLSGAGTGTITIRDVNDTVNRIVATTDDDGNRTVVTLDVS